MTNALKSRYRQALAEFDRLWQTGESTLRPQRMRALLLLIEACENASHDHAIEGNKQCSM
jgi:hypothetical protein